MTTAAAKEKLHKLIDQAGDEEVFSLLTYIEGNSKSSGYAYSDETLQMLRERSAEYSSGKMPTYTAEESRERIKNHRSKNGI